MVQNKRLTGLFYVGGKSVTSTTGTGKWVNSLLPKTNRHLYAEPFAGMLGILLQRDASRFEIVNDLDYNVTNWWRCVRDKPEELTYLIVNTPKSIEEYKWAIKNVNNIYISPVRRALAFTILMNQSIAGRIGGWNTRRKGANGSNWRGVDRRILSLAERLQDVQIDNKDALEVLDQLSKYDDAIIYCDPPYKDIIGGYGKLYGIYDATVDFNKLTEMLLKQKAYTAISGYDKDWDHLGWQRHEYTTKTYNGGIKDGAKRVEVLWTNYEVENGTES